MTREKIPIVYSARYNMRLYGMQHLHPFDTQKFKKVVRYLHREGGIHRTQFYQPDRLNDKDLLAVQTREFLQSLTISSEIARITGITAMRWIPAALLHTWILEPMRMAAGGTVLAVRLAMKHGWAVNLSGGYHHAESNRGGGFCVFADIPIAVYRLWQDQPDCRVLIVDLDAHQGNGLARILGTHPKAALFDIYNSDIFPRDVLAQQYVRYPFPIPSHTADAHYLEILRGNLPAAVTDHQPDLIVFNAGTDVYSKDPLGRLDLSEDAILQRDEFVLDTALSRKIPVTMVLSGGYHRDSGTIIGKSLVRLLPRLTGTSRTARTSWN